MKQKTIILIGIFMAISLIGICGLQWYWVSKALAEKEAEYDRSIQRGLYTVVNELKDAEIETLFVKKIIESNDRGESVVVLTDDLSESDKAQVIQTDSSTYAIKRTIETNSGRTSITQEVIVGSDDFEDVQIVQGNEFVVNSTNNWTLDSLNIDDDLKMSDNEANRLVKVLGNIIHSVQVRGSDYKPSLEKRIGKTSLDSLLTKVFIAEGIEAPFEYAMVSAKSGAIKGQYTNLEKEDIAGLDFSVPVFSDFPDNTMLMVGFPSKNTFIFRSLGDVLMLVLLFSLLMLGTFVATIQAILKQKRLAEVKSDFINNMTHEFKTPLATIGLAVDSINHPQVKSDVNQIDRFTGIIAEEKNRLNGHVEKILQLAKMEKGDLVIKTSPTDFSQVVADAVASMELRVVAREGSLTFLGDGGLDKVTVDGNHMYNALVNLIDNALKYSYDTPRVEVKLEREAEALKVTVCDRGIGMSKEVQKKAFDPFYRAQSGDVHNVKGFGVGLSYVREVVQLHGGSLLVKSSQGKGSTIGFKIPLNG